MFSQPPFSLGLPSGTTQSAFYIGRSRSPQRQITFVIQQLKEKYIDLESTRIQKDVGDGKTIYNLQVSVDGDATAEQLPIDSFELRDSSRAW